MLEAMVMASALLVVYTYFGYPLLIWLWSRLRPAPPDPAFVFPPVTVIIPAFNEECFIGESLRSILASDYPSESLDVLVVSDASSDRTDSVVGSLASTRIRLIRQPERGGKLKALQAALQHASRDIVLLADANSVFEPSTVKLLVRHFTQAEVGAVTGSKRTIQTGTHVSRGEGLYWRYEAKLRHLESLTGSSNVGVEGGLFAIRRSLLSLDFPSSIGIDPAMGWRVLERGAVTRYEPRARIFETASQEMGGEFSRKVRIMVRSIRAMLYFAHLLNPVRHPGFVFQNLSHKVLRRLLPFVLVTLFVSSGLSGHPLAGALFFLQCGFYASAVAGLLLKRIGVSVRILSIPIYFTVVNAAAFAAWFLAFKDFGVWTRIARESTSPIELTESGS